MEQCGTLDRTREGRAPLQLRLLAAGAALRDSEQQVGGEAAERSEQRGGEVPAGVDGQRRSEPVLHCSHRISPAEEAAPYVAAHAA